MPTTPKDIHRNLCKALETFSEFYAVPFTMLEIKYDLNHGDVKAGFGASTLFSVPF